MRLKDYVKDKILFLCFYCALLLLLFCFLRITGLSCRITPFFLPD